eukprot:6011467-Alexandrium_andersonii.AAC.1
MPRPAGKSVRAFRALSRPSSAANRRGRRARTALCRASASRVVSEEERLRWPEWRRKAFGAQIAPVSYTHLTLPTICSV